MLSDEYWISASVAQAADESNTGVTGLARAASASSDCPQSAVAKISRLSAVYRPSFRAAVSTLVVNPPPRVRKVVPGPRRLVPHDSRMDKPGEPKEWQKKQREYELKKARAKALKLRLTCSCLLYTSPSPRD